MSEESTASPVALRRAMLFIGPIAGTALALALHARGDSPALAITLGCLVWVALWWLFEPVPAAFTALIPMSVLPMAGVITPKQVAEAFGNELILLLMGGFMMAAALERNHAHRRLALGMVRAFGGRSGRHLLWGFVFATGLVSMWISNTAATLMMLPVAMAVLEDYRDERLRVPLVLGIAYAASIGGWGTPIGTPPNLVFMQVYEQTTGSRMGFLEWMRFGVPIVLLFLPLLALWLGRHLKGSPAADVPHLGPWHASERRVLMVFALIVAAWYVTGHIGYGENPDTLEHGFFATNSRTQLDWQLETHRITNRQMRLLMNMTLIMIDPAARGTCRVSAKENGDKLVFDVEALGQFSNFKSEVLDALKGNEPGGGWGGGAVQPYFTKVLAEETGFSLEPRIVPQAAGLTAIGKLAPA